MQMFVSRRKCKAEQRKAAMSDHKAATFQLIYSVYQRMHPEGTVGHERQPDKAGSQRVVAATH